MADKLTVSSTESDGQFFVSAVPPFILHQQESG